MEQDLKLPSNLTGNQKAAIYSLAYNVGTNAVKKSTLMKYVKKGQIKLASNEFIKWNKINGVEVKGLNFRRNIEKDLFLNK